MLRDSFNFLISETNVSLYIIAYTSQCVPKLHFGLYAYLGSLHCLSLQTILQEFTSSASSSQGSICKLRVHTNSSDCSGKCYSISPTQCRSRQQHRIPSNEPVTQASASLATRCCSRMATESADRSRNELIAEDRPRAPRSRYTCPHCS